MIRRFLVVIRFRTGVLRFTRLAPNVTKVRRLVEIEYGKAGAKLTGKPEVLSMEIGEAVVS